MKKIELEKILNGVKIYYNESENDINKEAANNCVTISFSMEDIDSLAVSDLKAALDTVEEFFEIKVRNIEKQMVFYSWIDEMIPAIRFGLVAKAYNKLPFDANYIEIKDKDNATNQFFEQLKSVLGPIQMQDLKQSTDDTEYCWDPKLKIYSKEIGDKRNA